MPRCWAAACEMTDLATTIATTALRTTDSQSWAVGLDVTKTLAVIALLGCSVVSIPSLLVARGI